MEGMLDQVSFFAKNKQNPTPTIVPKASSSSSWDNPFTAQPPTAPEPAGKKRSMAGWAKHKDRDDRRAEARKKAAEERAEARKKARGEREGNGK